jgi:Domain of unknown function (DUF4124)
MKYVVLMLMTLALSANADVFKCKNATGKIIYQAEPCSSGAESQGVINVKKLTPEETEAAKTRLNAWQEQQTIEEANKREAERQRQADLDRQQSLELQRRSVAAQEQQAIAAQQRQYQGGTGYIPPYGYGGYGYHPYTRPYYPYHNGGWNPGMHQPNVPWRETPAGQAPPSNRTPAGQPHTPIYPQPGQPPVHLQYPNKNGWGGGYRRH